MSYNSKPNAEHIKKLAKRLEKRWLRQSELDDQMLSYALMINEVDVDKDPKSGKPVKGFRSGIGGKYMRDDAALMKVIPGAHVNCPTEDPEDKEFASGTLEPWLSSGWTQSQKTGNAWFRGPDDLRILGRCWFLTYPHPRLWSDDNDEYKGLKEDLAGADSEEGTRKAEKALKNFKADEWPIRMRYVDPRGTWADFDGERWLPEVVELRKMTGSEIESAFDIEDLDAEKEYDVYEWANWYYSATVLENGEPEIIHEFHHNLGKSPYTLIEANLMPPNDKGWRWMGGLFYARGMIDTYDEGLSDLRENCRDNTRASILVFYDVDDDTPMTAGRPDVKADLRDKSTIPMRKGEDVKLAPIPMVNPQIFELIREARLLIEQTIMRPIEKGETKSGDSGSIFINRLQTSERIFDPYMRALADGAKDIWITMLRCVNSLGETVYAVTQFKGKGKLVGISPKQSRGWEQAIQPKMSRAIPIDRNLDAALAQRLLQPPIGLSPETVFEDVLGYANPQEEIRKARRYQLSLAAAQVADQAVLARIQANMQQASPEQQQQIQTMAPQAPAALQQIIAQAGVPLMPGGDRQAMANELRLAVPEQPQIAGLPA